MSSRPANTASRSPHSRERLEDRDLLVERKRCRFAERAERDNPVDAVLDLPLRVRGEKCMVDRVVGVERRGDRGNDAFPFHGSS
jgi:hypothetical protein